MRRPLGACVALVALAAFAGCASAPAVAPTTAPISSPTQPEATTASTAVATTATAAQTLLIEPNQGMDAIYSLLASARHSVDLTMYELQDTHAEQLLAADATHGVDVRVILDRAYIKSENTAAYSYLLTHGVHVRWATSLYALTHQKTLTIDGVVSVVMTLNWTSRYYSDTRDVAVIDRTPSDIAAIASVFNADYDGTRITPAAGADLVWSPTTSSPDLLGLINGARHHLLVENEEMDNTSITDALIAAAHRGVVVDVCMTNSSDWSSAFRELTSAGVHVRVYAASAALYIHAKVLVSDAGTSAQLAFVGSQNFSTESLKYNRELGMTLRGSAMVGQLAAMIDRDFAGASNWT
ncbi:MAG TPA: phospholipase D-like domain-containing protein [Candidatus Dormibacteraeota bacterium]